MSVPRAYAVRIKRVLEGLVQGSTDGLEAGQLRRQVKLGRPAVYRVCGFERGYVRVEVVVAPGLHPGQHFKFTRQAVARMQLVDDYAPASRRRRAAPASPPAPAGGAA